MQLIKLRSNTKTTNSIIKERCNSIKSLGKRANPFIILLITAFIFGTLMGCNRSGISNNSSPPEVTTTDPEGNEGNVSVTTSVSVIFSEPMKESTINNSTFTLHSDTLKISGTVSTTDTTAILSPNGQLEYGTTYTVTLSKEITDAAGKSMADKYQWNFTTEENEEEPAEDKSPPEVNSIVPVDEADRVPIDTDIIVTFNEEVNPSSINTSSFILQQNGNTVEGSVSYSDNTATFTPANNLDFNSTYEIILTTDVEDIAGNNLPNNFETSFTTEKEEQDDGEDENEESDTTPPSLSDINPNDQADNVPIGVTISVTFSEEMNTSTLNGNTFILQQSGSRVISSVEASGNTATLIPDGNLSYSTLYTVTVTTGAEDLAGNNLSETYITTFTTEEEPDNVPPEVVASNPTNGEDTVPVGTNIRVTFSEEIDPASVNGNTVTLEGPSGEVPASLDSSGDSIILTPNSELQYMTSYTLIVSGVRDIAGNSLRGEFSATFTTEEEPDNTPPSVVSSDPPENGTNIPVDTDITVTFSEDIDASTVDLSLRSAETNTNFQGSMSVSGNILTFTPNSSLQYDSDYEFVISNAEDFAGNNLQGSYSIIFHTEEAPDTTPPTVVSSNPADGDSTVSTGIDITVTFSEDIDPASVNETTVRLEGPSGVVPTSLDSSNEVVIISPDSELQYATSYTFTISGVRDNAGNSLQGSYSATFTTEENPNSAGE